MADTPTAPPGPARPRRRGLVPVLALVLAGASVAACAQQADSGIDARTDGGDSKQAPHFEATADYLGQAVARSEGQAYRFSEGVTMNAMGEHISADGFITGARKGQQSALKMDFGAMYRGMAGMPHLEGDLTMQVVTDGKTLYVRAPVFAALLKQTSATGVVPDSMKAFTDLDDHWGRIELGSLGGDTAVGRLMVQSGVQGSDPTALLGAVKGAADPHDLGSDTIRGEAVHGLGATLTFADLLGAQGLDADDYFGSLGSSLPAGADKMIDGFRNLKMPVEVWVDRDARVRRMVLDLDMSQMLGQLAGESGSFDVKTSVDLYDYGSPSISVDVPKESVDVTDAFAGNLTG